MSNDITVFYSKNTDDWKTPSVLYKHFMDHNYIDVAPFQSTEDYLLKDFYNQKLYCNPPYSKNKQFVEWLYKQVEHGCDVWMLIPSRTDTRYFQKMLSNGCFFFFIKGRLKYNDGTMGAPFPSVLIKLNTHTHQYANGTIDEFMKGIEI